MNKLTEHFSVEEMLHSDYAIQNNLENVPSTSIYYRVLFNLTRLCALVLEEIRVMVHKPIIVNSGYRSLVVNLGIGGVANSRHISGCAADFSIKGLSKAEIENLKAWARMNTNVKEFIVHDTYIHIAIAELYL